MRKCVRENQQKKILLYFLIYANNQNKVKEGISDKFKIKNTFYCIGLNIENTDKKSEIFFFQNSVTHLTHHIECKTKKIKEVTKQ